MPALPLELWREIVLESSTSDSLALARTNTALRDIVRPVLYKEVDLMSGSRRLRATVRGGTLKAALFARSLSKRPSLGGHVRRLVVHGGKETSRRPALCSEYPLFQSLSLFPNLRSLELKSFYIDSTLSATLSSQPALVAVKFIHCLTDPRLASTPTFSGISVSEITITQHQPSLDGFTAILPADLRSLTLYENLIPVPLSGLTVHGQHNALTTLELHLEYRRKIVPFLLTCPQLRFLSLFYIPRFQSGVVDPMDPLPAHALPLLESFSGSHGYIPHFIPGRPLHTVSITLLPGFPLDILRWLHQSSTPITTLSILFRDKGPIPTEFFHYMPVTLRTLRVRSRDVCPPLRPAIRLQPLKGTFQVPALSHIIDLSRMTDLRVFDMSAIVKTRERGEAVIKAVHAECGSLQEIVFGTFMWHWNRDGHWEHYRLCP